MNFLKMFLEIFLNYSPYLFLAWLFIGGSLIKQNNFPTWLFLVGMLVLVVGNLLIFSFYDIPCPSCGRWKAGVRIPKRKYVKLDSDTVKIPCKCKYCGYEWMEQRGAPQF